MKRIIALMLTAMLLIGAIGCSILDNADDNMTNQTAPQAQEPEQGVTEATHEPEEENNGEEISEPVTEQKGEAYEVVYTKGIVYFNSIGTAWLQAIVQIENTGSEALYLDNASLDAENAEGKLIKTMSYISPYPEVLNPGETALIVENTTLDSNPGVDELTIIPHLNIKKAKVDCIRYAVSEESLANASFGGVEMMGRVENTTSEAESMVYIVANLYDAEHHGIGQLFTILTNDLNPGEKIGFTLTTLSAPDSLTADSVASYEVFAFPIQFQF